MTVALRKKVLQLVRRVTRLHWGTRGWETERLITALFVTRVFNGYNYHPLTRKRAEQIETLNREAIRIVTGLPKFTPIADLYTRMVT